LRDERNVTRRPCNGPCRAGAQDADDTARGEPTDEHSSHLKPLFEDRDRNYNTSLVRMDAGAHYPSHHHAAIEEMFLLSGDLHLEGQVMRAGDYCRADRGSIHGETFTDDGCLFLLMASPENQIAENRVI
jgi:anti-sigma factor ChrR (cupin superfamily)